MSSNALPMPSFPGPTISPWGVATSLRESLIIYESVVDPAFSEASAASTTASYTLNMYGLSSVYRSWYWMVRSLDWVVVSLTGETPKVPSRASNQRPLDVTLTASDGSGQSFAWCVCNKGCSKRGSTNIKLSANPCLTEKGASR